MPDAGHLFELFQTWTPDLATQHRILVDQSRKALWLPELKVASTMSVNNKRVFYVKYLAHEIYADILRARPDVRLDRLENESPEETFAPILAAAHAYQIGAARDELARHFHVDQDLLRRAPNLLIVSSNGAGYDPVDVEACTEAGVLVRQPVRRQRAFGGRTRARHAAHAVETHHRGRPRAAARGECQPQCADRHRGAGQDHRHRRTGQCRPPHRRALQRPARHEGAGLRSLSDGRRDGGARRREGRAG